MFEYSQIHYVFLALSLCMVTGLHRTRIQLPNFDFYTGPATEPWLTGHLVYSAESQWQAVSDSGFELKDNANFEVRTSNISQECVNIHLVSIGCSFKPHICFSLRGTNWYGGGTIFHQLWPLGDTQIAMQPFVPRDLFSSRESYGNVIERYWLSSNGVGIYVTHANPLSASFNEDGSKQLCLMAPHTFTSSQTLTVPNPHLELTVCKTNDIKRTHLLLSGEYIAKPSGSPDERMFRSPIWSTWAKYKAYINDRVILEYANEIIKNNFSNSQLEIDDMYSSAYGEFDFSSEKFTDPKSMINKLKEKGFRVTVWVTPFANLDSNAFKHGLKNSNWVRFPKEVPALVSWWRGLAVVLDVYDSSSTRWFQDQLRTMKDTYGVDSFKFDAGEADYLPTIPADTLEKLDVSTYTTNYVKTVSVLGGLIEVRCGYRTQNEPVFIRMADKSSDWSYANGLRTLIPTCLTMGILGYPFVLPDMIGGNGYEELDDSTFIFDGTVLPDRELYIRWMQVTSYLPAMQFSIAPWQYDEEVVRLARKFTRIHEEVVTPLIVALAEEATRTGAPIIRPLWWIAPDNEEALRCDSQFLIGNEMLVAPIILRGESARDIYLPPGIWRDELKGETTQYTVGMWLKRYRVDIDQVPTFRLLSPERDEL